MDAAWATESRLTPDAADFVRFCYRRRRVGWPEIYDEMCAVASRGLFRGWGPDDLAQHGVGFGLFELPALAALVARIVSEEPPGRAERLGRRAAVARDGGRSGAAYRDAAGDSRGPAFEPGADERPGREVIAVSDAGVRASLERPPVVVAAWTADPGRSS